VRRLSASLAAFVATALCVPVARAWPAAPHVLISEAQTRGNAGASDEFVELVNPTCADVDLSGWTIAFRSTTAPNYSTRAVIPSGVHVGAGQHYLVAGSAYGGSVTPDLLLTNGIPDAGVLRLSDSVGNVIDGLGFYIDGTTQAALQSLNLVGTAASNLPHDNTNSVTSNVSVGLTRKDSGTHDDSDNASDFDAGVASTPESSTSADVSIDCGAGVGDPAPRQLAFGIAGRNPFRRYATLACDLPHAARVRIELYTVDGRRCATLVDRDLDAGQHLVPLDLEHANGVTLGPGVYLVRLTAGGERRSVRIVGLD